MNDSLPQLPEYEPHPTLWARIEAELMTDEYLTQVVRTLPDYEPKIDLWEAIEHELQTNETTTIRPLWYRHATHSIWAGVAAAAVVVLVGSWLFLQPNAIEETRMEYAVEQTDVLPPNKLETGTNQSTADKRAEDFIARQCAEQQVACQRPEVHELRNQLTSLTAEQQRLKLEQEIFGNDPALVRAQVRIENQRAEVTKELITLLRS